MRLFIAINLDHPNYFQSLQKPLRSLVGVRLTFPTAFHITLEFLGDVTPQVKDAVEEALSTTTFTPFILECSHLGTFPTLTKPRVIWAGFTKALHNKSSSSVHHDGYAQAVALAGHIQEALTPLGFHSDKAFMPHVTLARVKHADKQDLQELQKILATPIPNRPFTISTFELIESRLEKDGPAYTTIRTFPSTGVTS